MSKSNSSGGRSNSGNRGNSGGGRSGGRGGPGSRDNAGGSRSGGRDNSGGGRRGSSGQRSEGNSQRSGGQRGKPQRGSDQRGSDQRGSDQRGSDQRGSEGGHRSAQRSSSAGPPSRRGRPQGGGQRRSTTKPRGLGGDQVEGRQAVRELLLAGKRRIQEILIIDDMDSADILDDISELAFELKVPLRPINRKRMDVEALTSSHQGVIARAQTVPEHDLDTLAQKPGAFLLILDGVTDPGNLGAILRTAECAGVTGVVLPKHRSVHISPTVTKTAAGAVEHLPMALVGGIPAALTRLSELGVYTIGLDAGGDSSLFNLPIQDDRPIALVLGAEGTGLSRLVAQRVDTVAAIPLLGRLNSLNVAMAGAVACFEVVRMRQSNSPS